MRWRWVAVGGVAAGLLARRTLLVVRVEGDSMRPSYADGDRLLALRHPLGGRVRVGQVVVARVPAPARPGTDPAELVTVVKRVSATAGDPFPHDVGGSVAPPGMIMLSSDAGAGFDSARFGPVPVADVIARVITVVARHLPG